MWRFIQHRHAASRFGVCGPLIGQAHSGFVSLYECDQNARVFGYGGPELRADMIAAK